MEKSETITAAGAGKDWNELFFKTEEQLKNAPPGSLSLSCSKKWMQYYHRVPGEKGRGNYIQKKEQGLIRQLAQKSYDEKVPETGGKKDSSRSEASPGIMQKTKYEKIFFREHRERQRMIRPVEEPWESQLDRWMAEEYQGKPFKEGRAGHSDRTGREGPVQIGKNPGRLFLSPGNPL